MLLSIVSEDLFKDIKVQKGHYTKKLSKSRCCPHLDAELQKCRRDQIVFHSHRLPMPRYCPQ